MGTTASYVLLSNLPEYNDKISLVIGLAPVAFWKGNLPRILRFVADNFEAVQVKISKLILYELSSV